MPELGRWLIAVPRAVPLNRDLPMRDGLIRDFDFAIEQVFLQKFADDHLELCPAQAVFGSFNCDQRRIDASLFQLRVEVDGLGEGDQWVIGAVANQDRGVVGGDMGDGGGVAGGILVFKDRATDEFAFR